MALYDDIYEVAADNYGLITAAEAKKLGASDKELSRLASDGRLTRLGYGLYQVKHHVPEENEPYAVCVALAGEGAYLFGESVIAMHRLAPTDPSRVFVATPRRVRRSLSPGIVLVRRTDQGDVTAYEGIPSQSVAGAIRSCAGKMMPVRLEAAAREARRLGLVRAKECEALIREIGGAREEA